MPDASRQIAVSCHQLPRQTELVVQPEGWYLLLLLLLILLFIIILLISFIITFYYHYLF